MLQKQKKMFTQKILKHIDLQDYKLYKNSENINNYYSSSLIS